MSQSDSEKKFWDRVIKHLGGSPEGSWVLDGKKLLSGTSYSASRDKKTGKLKHNAKISIALPTAIVDQDLKSLDEHEMYLIVIKKPLEGSKQR